MEQAVYTVIVTEELIGRKIIPSEKHLEGQEILTEELWMDMKSALAREEDRGQSLAEIMYCLIRTSLMLGVDINDEWKKFNIALRGRQMRSVQSENHEGSQDYHDECDDFGDNGTLLM